ncbi:MAG: RNA polymerase sigma factor [Actinomycetota bacterium]
MTATIDRMPNRLAADLDAAFPDVVRTLQDAVYSGALQLTKNHHDAEDVTQETFVRAYRALSSYDADRIRGIELRPWVWTIALNLCRNKARSKKRHPQTVLDDARPAAVADPAVEAVEAADLAVWRNRLQSLSSPQRTAVVLRHIVDLGYEEIAASTGRPEATVRSDVRRGLARLRAITEEERR